MSTINIGKDGFYWWMGVIESRDDPLNLGRYKVRIFGWHTDNLSYIKTEDLPWAIPLNPVNASMLSATAQEGDYAFGFFMDNVSGQAPAILGVFPGIPQEGPNQGKGFSDARTPAQLKNSPRKPIYSANTRKEGTPQLYPNVIGEPSTSRLYRNENVANTFIGFRKETIQKDVPSVYGRKWSEPVTEYNTKAPYNRVLETESGHIMEFDDTPGAERIQTAHRSGTFEEIYPDGTIVSKIVKDNYKIVAANNKVLIQGDCYITVDKDSNVYIKGNTIMNVDGSLTHNVKGDYTVNVDKTFNVNADTTLINARKTATMVGKTTATVSSSSAAILNGNSTTTVGTSSNRTTVSGKLTTVSGTGAVTVSSLGYSSFSSVGFTSISGSIVKITGLPIGGGAVSDSTVSTIAQSALTNPSQLTSSLISDISKTISTNCIIPVEGATLALETASSSIISGCVPTLDQLNNTLTGFVVTPALANATGIPLLAPLAQTTGQSFLDVVNNIPQNITSAINDVYKTVTTPLLNIGQDITKNLAIIGDPTSTFKQVFNAAQGISQSVATGITLAQAIPTQLPGILTTGLTNAANDTAGQLAEAVKNSELVKSVTQPITNTFNSFVGDIKSNISTATTSVQNVLNKTLTDVNLNANAIQKSVTDAAIGVASSGGSVDQITTAIKNTLQNRTQDEILKNIKNYPITTSGVRG